MGKYINNTIYLIICLLQHSGASDPVFMNRDICTELGTTILQCVGQGRGIYQFDVNSYIIRLDYSGNVLGVVDVSNLPALLAIKASASELTCRSVEGNQQTITIFTPYKSFVCKPNDEEKMTENIPSYIVTPTTDIPSTDILFALSTGSPSAPKSPDSTLVAALWTACKDNTECTVDNSDCRDHICACKSGFVAAGDICVAGSGSVQDRRALYRNLLSYYQKDMAPDGPEGGPVVVFHSLTMTGLLALGEGILTMNIWEEMSWNDPRLTWNTNEYNISFFELPSGIIWQPDIVLFNNAEQYNGFPSGDIFAKVTYDGNVTYVPPKVTKSICQFDESGLYEKNEVECILKYGSWSHNLHSLDLRIGHQPDEQYLTQNPNWKVVEASAVRNVSSYPCCPESYVDIVYKLKIKRIK